MSGAVTNTKGGQLQVFHNGKIVTPQSLLPRKTASSNQSNKKMVAANNNQEDASAATADTIGEEKETMNKSAIPPMLKDKKLTMKK